MTLVLLGGLMGWALGWAVLIAWALWHPPRTRHHYLGSSYLETCRLCDAMWFSEKATYRQAANCPACGCRFGGCVDYKTTHEAANPDGPGEWGDQYQPSDN